MRFIKTDDLKAGMRLAKPIYNKNGVLLYDRNSALTSSGIVSVKNFGLIGIYILEPAEPLPPLSPEDIEFEQLQTIYTFQLRDCLSLISKHEKPEPLPALLTNIIEHYGSLNHRVNFNQNLRSSEDFMYKHAISTAILVTMMTSQMKYPPQKQMVLVAAALLYGMGYRNVPKTIMEKGPDLSSSDQDVIQQALEQGIVSLSVYRSDFEFFPRTLALIQAYIYAAHPERITATPDPDLQKAIQILRIADQFDQMTSMNVGREPVSEIAAMRRFAKDPKKYRPNLISTLAECIHIVPHAANVDLSTGDKGIVLVENTVDYMRPVILCLKDNQIYDLSQDEVYKKIQVSDIMKTMDNRISVDEETLKQFVPDKQLIELTRKFREALRRANEPGY